MRWLVPTAAAAVVIGGGAAAGTVVANADPALPKRSAAQLLVDVQNAKVAGLSGTVVETADLKLPALPGLGGGSESADLSKLVLGSNTARVWYAGDQKVRLAVVGTLGETDMVRNGRDVWLWSSREKTARHLTVPVDAAKTPTGRPAGIPSTPQEAADAALKAIDPTTSVTTTGAAKVAGRSAYELVLAPKDSASLIGQVRLAIDAKEHIPLRVDVYAKDATNPAVRVAFQDISFTVPDAQQFEFKAPPGTKVENSTGDEAAHRAEQNAGQKAEQMRQEADKHAPGKSDDAKVVGTGWTSVFVSRMPTGQQADKAAGQQLTGLLNSLPKVTGSWGSGHLLTSALFSALATDDGRVLVGAVTPDRLYQVAAQK